MSGSPLSEFTTLMESQGPAWMRGPEVLINEAARNTYTLPRFISGKNPIEMVQGGDEITDRIFFTEQSTWLRYNPNARFTYANNQTGVNWTVPWAFAKAEVSWTKHELGLNKENHTGHYRAQKYKAVMWQKHQNLWTDICNSLDDELWGQPNLDLMESSSPAGPRIPFSIPVFVNEETNGLPTTNGDVNGGTWTTVMGISPTVQSKWVPTQRSGATNGYFFNAGATITTVQDLTDLFEKMSRNMHLTRFDRLPKKPEYSDKTTSPRVIFTQIEGLVNYEMALRIGQDEFRGVGMSSGQDPDYNGPTFRGVPIEFISALGTNLLYDTGSTAGTSENADLRGPRYYGINGEYMKLVVHAQNYMTAEPVIRPSDQPLSRVQLYDCWNNFIARSRQRHWIISPREDTTNA